MRLPAIVLVTIVLLPADVDAQPSDACRREGISIGGSVAPALEGSGPWLLHGIRLGIPLTARMAVDLEAGWIEGGADPFGRFRHHATVQVRRRRAPRDEHGAGTYWIYGAQYLPEDDRDRAGQPRGRKPHVNGIFGFGGDSSFNSGVRLAGEVGLSGGEGILAFVKVALGWSRPRRDAGGS